MLDSLSAVKYFDIADGKKTNASLNFLSRRENNEGNVEIFKLDNFPSGQWATFTDSSDRIIICNKAMSDDLLEAEQICSNIRTLNKQLVKASDKEEYEKVNLKLNSERSDLQLVSDLLNARTIAHQEIVKHSIMVEFDWGDSGEQAFSEEKQNVIVTNNDYGYGDNVRTDFDDKDCFIYKIWDNTQVTIFESIIGEIAGIALKEAETSIERKQEQFEKLLRELSEHGDITII